MVVGKMMITVAEVRNWSWGPTGWQGRGDEGDKGAQDDQFCSKSHRDREPRRKGGHWGQ